MDERISRILAGFVEKLFDLDKMHFERVIIKRDVLDTFLELSKNIYPKEFLGFIDGHISDAKLIIDKLMYQEFTSDDRSALPIFRAPQNFFGSAHSHPGRSNKPSNADLQFFRKSGIVHMILCLPYDYSHIRFYDHNGEEINIEIEE